jgi:hypothetical protein
MIKKIMFATAKAGFKKLRKEHKSQVRRAASEFKKRKIVIPVEPYDLKKKAFKRSFRSTKFMDKAAYLAAPKTKKLPRGGKPTMVGKAFASDKPGKGLQVPMITKGQRKAIQRSISDSVRTFLREKGVKGYKFGGMNKKMFKGGLLTAGIKAAYKAYRKSGGKKVADRVRDEMKSLTKPAPRSQQLREDPGGRIKAFKFPVRDYKRLYGESEYSVKARKPSLRTLNKSDVKGRMKEDLKSKLRATKDKATRRKLIRDINKLD